MTTINSKEFLDSYHRGQLPFSFGGKHHVKDYVDISNADLDKNLSKSDVYTEFREFRKPKFTPPIRTYGKTTFGRLTSCFLPTQILQKSMMVNCMF